LKGLAVLYGHFHKPQSPFAPADVNKTGTRARPAGVMRDGNTAARLTKVNDSLTMAGV
jgi:hypothetical protein